MKIKRKANASLEIRNCLKSGIQAASEIAAIATKKTGRNVSEGFVSVVKSNMKSKRNSVKGRLGLAAVLILKNGGVAPLAKKIESLNDPIVVFVVACGGREEALVVLKRLSADLLLKS